MNYSKLFSTAVTFTLFVILAVSNICLGSVSRAIRYKAIPQSDIAERLLHAANAELPATEVVMTDNAASDLEFIVTKAANRLVEDNADEDKIKAAMNKAAELARGLKEHGTLREDGRIRIDRATIAGFRDWFCPTYPFC
ncbi:MAG TPA: hypothetical protein VE732_07055 [Nitrososphaera sp.]|nr:hypothetical protein [Nitrososphaera sp.]